MEQEVHSRSLPCSEFALRQGIEERLGYLVRDETQLSLTGLLNGNEAGYGLVASGDGDFSAALDRLEERGEVSRRVLHVHRFHAPRVRGKPWLQT